MNKFRPYIGKVSVILTAGLLGACTLFPQSFEKDDEKRSIGEAINQQLSSALDLNNSELEIEVKEDDFDTDFRLKAIKSIKEDNEQSFWLNQTNISNQSSDTTINIGLLHRKLSEDKSRMFGVNIFYDHEFPRNHQRASLGVENWLGNVGLSANVYRALSSDKTKSGTTERAMDGVDYEINLPMIYMPSSRFTIGGYRWDGNAYDVKSGVVAQLNTDVSHRTSISLGYENNDRLSNGRAIGKLNVKLGPVKKETAELPIFSSKPFNSAQKIDHSDKVYDFVKRQNRIVKTVSGSVTVARGT